MGILDELLRVEALALRAVDEVCGTRHGGRWHGDARELKLHGRICFTDCKLSVDLS